jgi:hypothetical protein
MGRVDLAGSDSCGRISVLSGYGNCLVKSLMSDTPSDTLSGFPGSCETPGGYAAVWLTGSVLLIEYVWELYGQLTILVTMYVGLEVTQEGDHELGAKWW